MNGQGETVSRLTFRDAAGDVAWQKQLRDRYIEDVEPLVDLSLRNSIVRPVRRSLAKQIILKYEWLGTLPPCSMYYGLFFGNYCAGVVCFIAGSVGANVNAHMEFKIASNEIVYLVRGANVHWSPSGANSRLVSVACKLISKTSKGKIVIAYSDTDAGEIGTIYQACNWVCIGRTGAPGQIVAPNGRIYDIRSVSSWAKQRKVSWVAMRDTLVRSGWREQPTNPKHKYVYILDKTDKALIDRVEHMRQPYPKRAGVVQRVEHGHQSETALQGDPPAPSIE